MNFLQRFFAGRNGMDTLNFALLVLSLILTLAASIVRFFLPPTLWWVLLLVNLVSYIPLALFLFRGLSRNLPARQRENAKAQKLLAPILFWQRNKAYERQDAGYRYYRCPNCSAQLRVPKGRGKIRITCPKCHREFVKKT